MSIDGLKKNTPNRQKQRLIIFSTYPRKTIISRHAPLPKMNIFTAQVLMVSSKSRSIYPSLKRIPSRLRRKKMPCSRAILSVYSALKMKAIRADSTIRHGPIIGLCSLTLLARLGDSNIRPMPILMNIRLFLLKSTVR